MLSYFLSLILVFSGDGGNCGSHCLVRAATAQGYTVHSANIKNVWELKNELKKQNVRFAECRRLTGLRNDTAFFDQHHVPIIAIMDVGGPVYHAVVVTGTPGAEFFQQWTGWAYAIYPARR